MKSKTIIMKNKIAIIIFLMAFFTKPVHAGYFPPCFPFCKVTPRVSPTLSPTRIPTPSLPVVTPTTTPQLPKIYYGAYTGDNADMSKVATFEQQAGKKLSIISWYQGWVASDDSKNFQTAWMNNVRSHGSIPMITWESWDYTKGVNQPTFTLKSIINGNHDAYITKWALDSKAWGKPYFLRFNHEMNNPVYPWTEGVNGNKPGEYVLAWKHVKDIFTQNGVTNVAWVWSVNVTTSSLAGLYPGDSYTDWVAMDGYNGGSGLNWGGWKTFTQVFTDTYLQLTTLSNKPIMISETGSSELGGNKANWIKDGLGSQIDTMPRVKALVWFNASREADWRINSSNAALNAFKSAIANNKYYSNSFTNLNQLP